MSQNKTRVPGMEDVEDNNYGGFATGRSQAGGRRPGTQIPGTVVTGLEDYIQNVAHNPQVVQKTKNKPIVGFLYSVSRKGITEFWPLYLGPNTIGCDNSNDIVLSEATVSGKHAVLQTREMKNSGQIIAAITDSQSTNGTLLNNESLGFAPVPCEDGDVITIGSCYQLLVIIINAKQMGLAAVDNFIPTSNSRSYAGQPASDSAPVSNDNSNQKGTIPNVNAGSSVPPKFTRNKHGYSNQTVGLDGNTGFNSGGTDVMG